MKHLALGLIASLATVALSHALHAEDGGNWKIGRIYYRAVCTACHETTDRGSISPASQTIAEWEAWAATEKGVMHMAKFTNADYRASVSGENRVAAKFAAVPEADLAADVLAFLVYGAKDSATPATCD